MDRLCRLCGEEKSLGMRPIFEPGQPRKSSLGQTIVDVARLDVEPDDGLPQLVCQHCISTLLKTKKSIEFFRDTDEKLRKQLLSFYSVEIKQEEDPEMEVEALEEISQQDQEVDFDGSTENAVKGESLIVKPDISEEIEYLDESAEHLKDSSIEAVAEKKVEDPSTSVPKKKNRRRGTEKEQKPKRPWVRRDPNDPHKYGRGKKDPSKLLKNDFKCYICNVESLALDSAEALLFHLNEQHSDLIPFKCTECVMEEVVINGVSTLNNHKRMHTFPFKCEQCDRRFPDKRNIYHHTQSYHNPNAAQTCERCGKVCTNKQTLNSHMKQHTNSYPCEYCGKTFIETSKLTKHINCKHIGIKHECQLCHKKLISLDSLHIHLKTMHSKEQFKCPQCPKTYTTELSLRAHMKNHNKSNYVPCNNWQEYYEFVQGDEGLLKNGVRLKKCKLCGEVKSQIGSHLKQVHFPEEFRCEICNATYKRKEIYEAHLLEHSSGRVYKCPICGKDFTMKKNLVAHLRTKQHRDHPLAKSLDWLEDPFSDKNKRKEAMAAVASIRNRDLQPDVVEELSIEDNLLE